MQFSERLNKMLPSATLEMAKMSRELKKQGHNIISLSLGEPDFYTPDYIKEAAKEGIDQNYSRYMPVNGYEDLRQSICNKLKRDNNLDYNINQIVVSTGSKQSLSNVFLAFLNKGDEVLIPAPYWVTYYEQVKMAGGVPVVIPSDIKNDFKVKPSNIESYITDKTKLFIYSSPCNPSGSVYTKEELKSFADFFVNHPNIYIISDEIYEHINYVGSHQSIAQFDNIKDRIIIVNGVSKAFAMTGWRVGYIAASEEVAKACTKIQGQVTSGTSSISQRAAKKALDESPERIKDMTKAFVNRRKLILELLRDIDGIEINEPEGAFYAFPKISNWLGTSYKDYIINTSNDLCMYLLKEAKVALVTGEAFGLDEYIRISYAASEKEITEALSRIKEALQKLK